MHCCSSLSPHPLLPPLPPQHSPLLSSHHGTHAAGAPVLLCQCLPPSLLLPSCPLCPVLCLQPILSWQAGPVLCSRSAHLLPSHLLLFSPTAWLCSQSQRHRPALSVPSERPVCCRCRSSRWASRGGVAAIALKSPCRPPAPMERVHKCDLWKGIKSYCIVRAYYRIPGT
jgi:hypothetical protein